MKRALLFIRYLTQFCIMVFVIMIPALSQYRQFSYTKGLSHAKEEGPSSFVQWTFSSLDFFVNALASLSNRDHVLSQLDSVGGNTVSLQFFRISLTDLLAGTESILASHSIGVTLLISMLIPFLVTILLGRIFCSWICPVGFLLESNGKVRRLPIVSYFQTKDLSLWRGNKYIILTVGLILSALVGFPLLVGFYPPALFVREVHNEVFFLFQRAGKSIWNSNLAGLTGASFFILGIMMAEIFVAKRMWCRYLCPGGALYAVLGRIRILRIVGDESKCNHCGKCAPICDMGLNPIKDASSMECDNCLACVSTCQESALPVKLSIRHPFPRDSELSKKPSMSPHTT